MPENKKNQKGFIATITTFFIMVLMLALALSIASLIIYRTKISINSIKSTQSYYASESGIEDALLRLSTRPQMPFLVPYYLSINGAETAIDIGGISGGSRDIVSTSDNGVVKKIKTTYSIDSTSVGFYYGIEVGAGGLHMNNGSRIKGNVFSDGNISGSGTIDNNVIVSGNGNSIEGVYVGGDAMAYGCLSSASVNSLIYVEGGEHTCMVRSGSATPQAEEISQHPAPIDQIQINRWKAESSANECNSSDVAKLANQNNKTTIYMGFCKISGNLVFANKQNLVLTGTLYVLGNISFANNDSVTVDPNYSNRGGVIITDGTIDTGTGNEFSGNGQENSYLLFVSTSSSNPAIYLKNNSGGAAFYATAGTVRLANNISVAEVTGYKIEMDPNSTVEYSIGLENIYFSSGPSGGWKVTSWQEQ